MRRVFAPEKKECTRCCLAVVSYGFNATTLKMHLREWNLVVWCVLFFLVWRERRLLRRIAPVYNLSVEVKMLHFHLKISCLSLFLCSVSKSCRNKNKTQKQQQEFRINNTRQAKQRLIFRLFVAMLRRKFAWITWLPQE